MGMSWSSLLRGGSVGIDVKVGPYPKTTWVAVTSVLYSLHYQAIWCVYFAVTVFGFVRVVSQLPPNAFLIATHSS